jgi:hypothetical protein
MRLPIAIFIAIGLLIAGLLLAARGQNNAARPSRPLSSGFATYNVLFDGTNYLAKTNLAGIVDSRTTTFACWLNVTQDGTDMALFSHLIKGTPDKFGLQVRRTTANLIRVRSTANLVTFDTLDATSSQTVKITNGWVHFMITVNLADTGQRHMYFNGVEDASVSWTTYNNNLMDFVDVTSWDGIGVASDNFANAQLRGALAEMWWATNYLADPTKFVSAGCPVDLGATGQTPTGATPIFYFSRNGNGNSWAVDSSVNANTFAVVTSLLTTNSPCQ